MKPATAFELRLILNMTDEQLDATVDYMLELPRMWTLGEYRAAKLFLNEHNRRLFGEPMPPVPIGVGLSFS